ncbi:hypothetical protein [Conexibacter sp. S30A1]|uniref:hypothetical protein n=1 Tax=Conexibacter sp. S30A1 TaxID=2937800 RepID=UPI00200D8330|nr:hypothetical protein [Conexibacter sp. S30A1]
MANDRLADAISASGVTLEAFAGIVGVDPKSVGRWVNADTVPHARRRRAIARALNTTEQELWPALSAGEPAGDSDPADSDSTTGDTGRGAGDVTGTWAHPDQPDAPDLVALINTTEGPIEILDPYGRLEIIPGLLELLSVHAAAGRQVRVITDQDTPGYGTLADAPGVEIAAGQIHMDTWFIQADGTMIAGINLPAETLQFNCPLIELDATIPGGLAERLHGLFEELWQTAPYTYSTNEPESSTTADADGVGANDPHKQHSGASKQPSAKPSAGGPAAAAAPATGAGRPPRRWPGRTD